MSKQTFLRDWQGNNQSMFVTNGDSNHSSQDRQVHDFYATPPDAVEQLLHLESFSKNILEPCCGAGHIVGALQKHGYDVDARDLYDYGAGFESGQDFLDTRNLTFFEGDVITNPPYCKAQEFVERALDIIPEGNKVAMFLKLSFLEGQARRLLFDKCPPQTVYVASKRYRCGKNGDFSGGSAVAYAWFVWTKGYKGSPAIRWFN